MRTSPDAAWSRTRTIIAGALLAIAVVLTPIAITTTTLGATLTDSDRFSHTFESVVRDPDVQDALTDAVGAVVTTTLAKNDPTAALQTYVSKTNAPRAVTEGVGTLSTYAMHGIDASARDTIRRFVTSDAFATIWQRSLLVVHRTLLTPVTSKTASALLRLDPDGTLWLQVRPLASLVKAELKTRAPFIAQLMPSDAGDDVALVQEPALAEASAAVKAVPLLLALPWVALVILVSAGVLLSRSRYRTAVRTAGIASGVLLTLAIVLAILQSPVLGTTGQLVEAIVRPVRDQTVGALLLAGGVLAAFTAIGVLVPRGRRWLRATPRSTADEPAPETEPPSGRFGE